jgi:hypothetical protein
LRYRLGVQATEEVCKRNRLRLFGHVERKVDDDWMRRCALMEVDGRRSRGRPRKMRRDLIEDDLNRYDLHVQNAMDQCLWRGKVHGANWPTQVILENQQLSMHLWDTAVKPTCVCV